MKFTLLIPVMATLLLAGCGGLAPRMIIDRQPEVRDAARPASPSRQATTARGGGYYKDDGPGDNPPDLAAIPDADPRIEPLRPANSRPYNVFGVDYTPLSTITPFVQRGLGSWYGRKFHGQKTASGEIYDMYGMTAAHTTLPIPSYVRVTHIANGRSVIVRVNDRGPFHSGRIIDLSYSAAWKLGYIGSGSAMVEVELLTPELIAALPPRGSTATTVEAVATATAPQPEPARDSAQVIALKQYDAPRAAPMADTPPVAPATTPLPPRTQTPVQAPSQTGTQVAVLPVESTPGGVFLQLGAFSARDNAESFRVRVYRELSWLNDAINILPNDGLFRLHLGPYRDRTEAGSMAERIRDALELKPMIVVR